MNPGTLAREVIDRIKRAGIDSRITLVVPGRCPKSGRKRLIPRGRCPVGDVMNEGDGSCVVSFSCADLSAFLAATGVIDVKIVEVDGAPGGLVEFTLSKEWEAR